MKKQLKRTLEVLLLAGAGVFACAQQPVQETDYRRHTDNAYLFRVAAEVETVDKKTEHVILSTGSSFLLSRGLTSYFVTNRHVVQFNLLPGNRLQNGSIVKHVEYYLANEGQGDKDLGDDYKLTLVALDDNSDTALLSYRLHPEGLTTGKEGRSLTDMVKDLPIPPKTGDTERGDTVYTIGYGLQFPQIYSQGVVATEETQESMKYFLTTIPPLPGMSGGPVYKYDNGTSRLVGFITAGVNDWNYSIVTDIEEAEDLLKSLKKDSEKQQEYIKELAGPYYELLDH